MRWRAVLRPRCVLVGGGRRFLQGRMVCARWSSGGGGGGGEDERGKNQRRAGFIENFIKNFQQGLQRNKDMQESLKGLREERERMQKSYVIQQWKEQVSEGWERAGERGRKGFEAVKEQWKKTRKELSKVANSFSLSVLVSCPLPLCVCVDCL